LSEQTESKSINLSLIDSTEYYQPELLH
jgi:hypothetical protein